MSIELILLGLLPALAFILAAVLLQRRAALLVAFGLALLEAAYTIHAFGGLDSISALCLGSAVAMAGLAALRDDERIFRLLPTVQDLLLAGSLAYFYFFLKEPLLLGAVQKYARQQPWASGLLADPFILLYLRLVSRDLIWWFLAHAAVSVWASNRGRTLWFTIAVVGQLVVIIAAVLLSAGMAWYGQRSPELIP